MLYWFFNIFVLFYEFSWYSRWDEITFHLLFFCWSVLCLHERYSHCCCCWVRYRTALAKCTTPMLYLNEFTIPTKNLMQQSIFICKVNAIVCDARFYKIRKSVYESGWPRCYLTWTIYMQHALQALVVLLGEMYRKWLFLFLWWWWRAMRKTLKIVHCIRKLSVHCEMRKKNQNEIDLNWVALLKLVPIATRVRAKACLKAYV